MSKPGKPQPSGPKALSLAKRVPRSPLSLLRWLINARPADRRGGSAAPKPRVAGVMATKDYTECASVFETLQALSDVTLVLDDNSSTPFPHRDECSEYIALRSSEPWNCPSNQTLLMYRAFVHGCEWVVSLDDDLIPSHGFQSRRDVAELISEMRRRKADACYFRLLDLWDSKTRTRGDGPWSQKVFNVCRRNWFYYDGVTLRDPSLRLHTPAFPTSHRMRRFAHPEHILYHTGCMTPALRTARVEKYRREDPANRFQNDYEYMLDEQHLKLDPVPEADAAIIEQKCRAPAVW